MTPERNVSSVVVIVRINDSSGKINRPIPDTVVARGLMKTAIPIHRLYNVR
jgi:hypothetical protein